MRWTRGDQLLIEDTVGLSFDGETKESACFISVVDINVDKRRITVGAIIAAFPVYKENGGKWLGIHADANAPLVPLDQR